MQGRSPKGPTLSPLWRVREGTTAKLMAQGMAMMMPQLSFPEMSARNCVTRGPTV